MDEKKEAQRLIDRYIKAQSWRYDDGAILVAKKLALITVGELMKEASYINGRITKRGERWKFWDDVKTELENLTWNVENKKLE
jgi:hypothetical protein